jgi:hypothetical protein
LRKEWEGLVQKYSLGIPSSLMLWSSFPPEGGPVSPPRTGENPEVAIAAPIQPWP